MRLSVRSSERFVIDVVREAAAAARALGGRGDCVGPVATLNASLVV